MSAISCLVIFWIIITTKTYQISFWSFTLPYGYWEAWHHFGTISFILKNSNIFVYLQHTFLLGVERFKQCDIQNLVDLFKYPSLHGKNIVWS